MNPRLNAILITIALLAVTVVAILIGRPGDAIPFALTSVIVATLTPALPGRTPPDVVDRVAVAIAVEADAHYWDQEIADWEDSEPWEREAHPENYPSDAYEDRALFREQARAAIAALGRS